MPKLSIIISAYNSGEWMKNRLDNLYASTIIDQAEVIVVNAASPDELDHTIPQAYPAKYLKLDERVGLYSAWNIAINNSSGEYITNANTDDIVSPNLYSKLCALLDGGADFAYPSWYVTNIANQQWDMLDYVDPSGRPGHYAGDVNTAGVGHFPMWRRSLHDKVGLFDERYRALGDADFWARCYFKANAKFSWLNEMEACYLYRNGENLWHQMISSDEWQLYHQKLSELKKT